eukprot:m.57669 g.57669  ORF g.57669 m.57669 type:complete len:64 (+) comp13740_c0_seq1:104-295(+)
MTQIVCMRASIGHHDKLRQQHTFDVSGKLTTKMLSLQLADPNFPFEPVQQAWRGPSNPLINLN